VHRTVKRVLIGFVLLGLVVLTRDVLLMPDGRTHAEFFDVGQGDSALLTFTDGTRMLIDGGPDWRTLEELGKTLPLLDRRIDIVVLSHPNSDHMMSLPEVLRRYRVRTLLTAGTPFESGWYAATLSGAVLAGTKVVTVRAGDRIEAGAASVRVVWPPVPRPPGMNKDVNNDSLTLMVEAGGKKLLFTGDLEDIVEKTLLAAKADLKADILKVPHHGSRSSSSTGFLLAVDPEIAVISVGRNNTYGHPAPAVVRRLQSMGIAIRRTDEEGTVRISW
jgi:competence protein ComEC